jgi:serine/threonine protein kinase
MNTPAPHGPDHPTPTDQLAAGDFTPLTDLPPGPRYTRSALHATGGMGAVWRAWDATLGREVALKELKEDGTGGERRFVREAKLTGRLEHPGVVPVYELGTDPESGRPFYVMKFLRGRTLSESVRAFHSARRPGWYPPMDLVRLLSAFVSVCNTVGYAHSRGIVHRDLKGENIILGEFGEVVVLDWGVAKVMGETESPEFAPIASPASTLAVGQTKLGDVVGTVAYMAPEQAEGIPELVGPLTDVFGLGAILYEILCGCPPYSGVTYQNVLLKAMLLRFPPPRECWPEVPAGLEAICLKAMAKEPGERFASAVELGLEIQGWQDRERRQAEDDLRGAFDRLRRQQAAVAALVHADVFSSHDLSAILRQLVEVAARTLGVARVSIWRRSADGHTLRCDALFELHDGRHSSGMTLDADAYPNYFAALSASDVISAPDARTDPRTREFADGYLVPLGITSMMEVPVHPNGVLCHEHIGDRRAWLPDEELFAVAVGHIAAHAISHWERRRVLERLGVADTPPR